MGEQESKGADRNPFGLTDVVTITNHDCEAHSHLITQRIGSGARTSERIATLQLILQEAVESLQRSPRKAK